VQITKALAYLGNASAKIPEMLLCEIANSK